MKNVASLLITLLLTVALFSKDIPRNLAERVAVNFFFERISQYKTISHDAVFPEEVIIIERNGKPCIYAVNIQGGGFVLVSANDHVRPVAGYSLEGKYTGHGLPPQLSELMDLYAIQVADAGELRLHAGDEIRMMWDRLLSNETKALQPLSIEMDVEPLLNTQWDQGQFYNEMCPADPAGPGGHCYAGCVATTLGQVVNYFRWPETGTGSYTYSCPPYGDLTADFENTTYEWDKMATSLNKSNLAVALLLHHLGIGCDMVYGPNGSGMYNHKAAFTLREYFKYSPETQYVYRDSTTMDWDSLIITHLDRKIPLYYAGWSVPNINGHAFVCDGYQAGNYYHFNWGWSGSYDGYFYTNALNPGGSNFNLAQELVINAFPDTNAYVYPVQCEGDKLLTGTDGTIDDGSGPIYGYADDADCSWLIKPDDSVNSISLEFLRFETEPGDVLNVYDGETSSAPLLGSFSGSEVPAEITSSGDRVLITFVSDASGTAPGWLLSYSCEIPVYCSGMQNLTAQSGDLSDGSGPRNYHNNTTCMWMAAPPGASEITIYFTSFETEAEYDRVKIYDPTTQELLADLSGNELPEPVSSPSGKLFITFSTNYTNTAAGWEAYYETDLVGIDETDHFSNVQLYPNPAQDIVQLYWHSAGAGKNSISLHAITGTTVKSIEHLSKQGKNQAMIDISGLSPGIYLLKLASGTDVSFRKLVVRR